MKNDICISAVTRSHHGSGAIALLFTAVLAAGCGSQQNDPEDSSIAAVMVFGSASDLADAPEMPGALPGGTSSGGASPGPLALPLLCDPNPDITSTEVCGKQMPATISFEWTGCTASPGGIDGDHDTPPDGAAAGSSSGKLDIANSFTVSPDGPCGEGSTIEFSREATFEVLRSALDGRSMSLEGSLSMTGARSLFGPSNTAQMAVNATLEMRDSSGSTVRSMGVTGNVAVAFNGAATPPTRTYNGAVQMELSDGDTTDVALHDVVRVPPTTCTWPIAGTVVRTAPDGSTHTLALGPGCGQATLDGNPITLDSGSFGVGGPRP